MTDEASPRHGAPGPSRRAEAKRYPGPVVTVGLVVFVGVTSLVAWWIHTTNIRARAAARAAVEREGAADAHASPPGAPSSAPSAPPAR